MLFLETYKEINTAAAKPLGTIANNARLFSTPSTCYQSKPRSETFTIDRKEKPGYRIIHFSSNGDLETEVVRMS